LHFQQNPKVLETKSYNIITVISYIAELQPRSTKSLTTRRKSYL
jgi:hypothetical protein